MSEPTLQMELRHTSYLYLRHRWPVRLTHWINVLSLTILLMSGLMIFNAHPSLDWGKSSYSGKPSFLEITSRTGAGGQTVGITRVFGHEFETTGLLGVAPGVDGNAQQLKDLSKILCAWQAQPLLDQQIVMVGTITSAKNDNYVL